MVAHLAGKLSFVGVRAVGEGWGRGACFCIRERERWDSGGREMEPTDCKLRKKGQHGIKRSSRARNSTGGCAGRRPETEKPPRE